MRTLKFTSNVHLSENFGGIAHGQKIKPDVSRGAVHEIDSDELADHLVGKGLAEEIKPETSSSAAPEKPNKKNKGKKQENEPVATGSENQTQ